MTASLRELGLEGDGQVGMVQEHSMSVAFHNRDDFPPKLPVEEMGSRQKIQQTQPGKQKLHLPPIGDLVQVLRNKVPFTLEAIPLKDPTGAGRFP